MIPAIEHSSLLTILFWVLMIPIAMFVLLRVTDFWTEEGPGTVFNAARAILLMGAAVFLTYDISGYVFARMMQDPELGICFPANYHYWDWIREPVSLKWQFLGFVPMIRYLPVVFALLAGGIVQVVLWKIPFREGMIVFVSQIVLDVFAMALLSFVFSFFAGVHEGAVAEARPQQKGRNYTIASSAPAEPGGLQEARRRLENLGADEGPFFRRLWARWQSVNGVFDPVYDFLQPVTGHLPLHVQDFLNGGGWLIVVPGTIVLVRYWPRIRRRKR
jgi:hypothetical protein